MRWRIVLVGKSKTENKATWCFALLYGKTYEKYGNIISISDLSLRFSFAAANCSGVFRLSLSLLSVVDYFNVESKCILKSDLLSDGKQTALGLSTWTCRSWVLLLLILLQFVVELPRWEKRNPPLFFQRQHTLLPLRSPEKTVRLSGVSVLTTRLTDAGRSCHLWCLKLCLKMCLFCS